MIKNGTEYRETVKKLAAEFALLFRSETADSKPLPPSSRPISTVRQGLTPSKKSFWGNLMERPRRLFSKWRSDLAKILHK